MQPKTLVNSVGYGVLGLVVCASFLLPTELHPQDAWAVPMPVESEQFEISGVIRDFHTDHPDFNTAPGGENGHYAGTVQHWLPGNLRPSQQTGGYKVDDQWIDSHLQPIAPHLAGVLGGYGDGNTLGIRVVDEIKVEGHAAIDAFNSSRGVYGYQGNYSDGGYMSTNTTKVNRVQFDKDSLVWSDVYVGPGGKPGKVIKNKGRLLGGRSVLDQAYPISASEVPLDADATAGDLLLDGVPLTLTGTIWDEDAEYQDDDPAITYDNIKLTNGGVLNVEGDLRLICETWDMDLDSSIVLGIDANLTVYITGDHFDLEKCLVNVVAEGEDADTTNVTFNYLGNAEISLKEAHVYGTISAPFAKLKIDKGAMYGAFIGNSLELKSGASFHIDHDSAGMGALNPAITARKKVEIKDNSVVDHFDSSLGIYSEVNKGDKARITVIGKKKKKAILKVHRTSMLGGDAALGFEGAPQLLADIDGSSVMTGNLLSIGSPTPIPAVTPIYVAESSGDVEYKNTVVTISADARFKKLKLSNAIMWIDGDVTIRIDDKLEMNKSAINLIEGATLTLYVKKDVKLEDYATINAGGNPQHVSIRRMSLGKKGKVEMKKFSSINAWVQGAKTELKLKDSSEFFGSFIGEKVKVEKSKLHVDMAGLINCTDIDDTPGVAGALGSGGVTSPETFEEWFRDVLGVNQSKIHTLTLTKSGGVFEYLDDAFYPLDDRLYGNEGKAHNYNFTYAIKGDFTYSGCDGQFLEFSGGDGAWIYVNGKLVMDLGGYATSTAQFVELDRLGLDEGVEYSIAIFYAQRRSTGSSFRLRTNIEVSTDRYDMTISAVFD